MAIGKAFSSKAPKFGQPPQDDLATGESVWAMLSASRAVDLEAQTRSAVQAPSEAVETPQITPSRPVVEKPAPEAAGLNLAAKPAASTDFLFQSGAPKPPPLGLKDPAPLVFKSAAPPKSVVASQPIVETPSKAEAPPLDLVDPEPPAPREPDISFAIAEKFAPISAATRAPGLRLKPVDEPVSRSEQQAPFAASKPTARQMPIVLIGIGTVALVFGNALFLEYAPTFLGRPIPAYDLELRGRDTSAASDAVQKAAAGPVVAPAAPSTPSFARQAVPLAPSAAPNGKGDESKTVANATLVKTPVAQPAVLKPVVLAPVDHKGAAAVARLETVVAATAAPTRASAPAPLKSVSPVVQPSAPKTANVIARAVEVRSPAPAPKTISVAPAQPVAANRNAVKATPVIAPAAPAVAVAAKTVHAPDPVSKQSVTSGPFVQVGAFPSEALAQDGAHKAWAAAGGKGVGQSAQVQPVTKDAKTLYRALVAGFASKDEAQRFCALISAKGVACFLRN